jgi:HK97 family phage prohead protease
MTTMTLEQAAAQRCKAIRAQADRPSSRRAGEARTAQPVVRASSRLEVRAGDAAAGSAHFHGIASVTGQGYEMWDMFGPYTELVSPGAFGKTLANPDLDVPLVLQHDPMRRLARTKNGTLSLAETELGLEVDAPQLDTTDPDVAYILPKLRSGLIDEMSFKFQITAGQWSPDWMEFHIEEVDIDRGDVAIVGYGANPYTSGELRSALLQRLERSISEKRALDPEDVNVLTQILGQVNSIDSIVDELLESLSSYLGVPNPDPDEPAGELAAAAAVQKLRASISDDDVRPRVIRGING